MIEADCMAYLMLYQGLEMDKKLTLPLQRLNLRIIRVQVVLSITIDQNICTCQRSSGKSTSICPFRIAAGDLLNRIARECVPNKVY